MSSMKQFFPFLEWLIPYDKSNFSGDLSAGLTVGVMLIPQGMAYAMLAGLPPIYGLYASTVPLIVYALFGTSRKLAVGPVALDSLLVASGVGALAVGGSPEYIGLAILLASMVGMIQLTMGVFRLGFLVNFLSHPVIAGFTSGAALIIGFSQLKHLLGIDIARGKIHETILQIAQNIQNINPTTLILGLATIGVLVFIKKMKRRIPGPLIVVFLGILVVYFGGLADSGVAIIRDIPDGLPSFSLPAFSWQALSDLLPTALAIAFIGFMESTAVSKALQARHKGYKVVPNQELIALGLTNIIGSFFKAFPTTGGFSRTAVNDQAGAQTGLAAMISASVIILTLLFFTSYFYYLPTAVLAAIIMVAVSGLIDVKEAKHLWHTDRTDFILFMLTALGTLFLGIKEGIIIGVLLSLGMMIYRVSYPHIAHLGQIPETPYFRNVNRFEGLIEDNEILILRLDAPLFFANTNYIREKIISLVDKKKEIKAVIIQAQTISSIDSSALHMLQDLIDDYEKQGISFYFTGLIGPVRDILEKGNLFKDIGEDHFFMNVHDAVRFVKDKDCQKAKKEFIFQTGTI